MNAFQLGSDFESLPDSELTNRERPPWERARRPTVYLETGRQALALIAEDLGRRGRDHLLVPGLLCNSMVEPFVERGWTIRSLGLRGDLGLPANSHEALESAPERTVILLAAYFGGRPDAVHRELVERARLAGAKVIEDETHRVFQPGGVPADFHIASLRKLLPVGDGAYLQGEESVLRLARELPTSDSLRWAAMDAKRDALEAGSLSDYRTLLRKENHRLELTGRRFGASLRTLETLRSLPYERMARIRMANATHLQKGLSGRVPYHVVSEGVVPSHVVLHVADPKAMQARLARRGVYCAIHWPRVERVAGIAAWRDDLLSVPVDHRYGAPHMELAVEMIVEELDR